MTTAGRPFFSETKNYASGPGVAPGPRVVAAASRPAHVNSTYGRRPLAGGDSAGMQQGA